MVARFVAGLAASSLSGLPPCPGGRLVRAHRSRLDVCAEYAPATTRLECLSCFQGYVDFVDARAAGQGAQDQRIRTPVDRTHELIAVSYIRSPQRNDKLQGLLATNRFPEVNHEATEPKTRRTKAIARMSQPHPTTGGTPCLFLFE